MRRRVISRTNLRKVEKNHLQKGGERVRGNIANWKWIARHEMRRHKPLWLLLNVPTPIRSGECDCNSLISWNSSEQASATVGNYFPNQRLQHNVVSQIEFPSRRRWLHRTKRPRPQPTYQPAATARCFRAKRGGHGGGIGKSALTAQCTCTKIAFSLMLFLIISTRQNVFFPSIFGCVCVCVWARGILIVSEMNLSRSFSAPRFWGGNLCILHVQSIPPCAIIIYWAHTQLTKMCLARGQVNACRPIPAGCWQSPHASLHCNNKPLTKKKKEEKSDFFFFSSFATSFATIAATASSTHPQPLQFHVVRVQSGKCTFSKFN